MKPVCMMQMSKEGDYSQGSRKQANQVSIRNPSFREKELTQDGRQGGSRSTGRISRSNWMTPSLGGGKPCHMGVYAAGRGGQLGGFPIACCKKMLRHTAIYSS